MFSAINFGCRMISLLNLKQGKFAALQIA